MQFAIDVGAARWSFESVVDYPASWVPGNNRGAYLYDPITGQIKPSFRNVTAIGFHEPPTGVWYDFLKEGGALSKALNVVPGMNSLAQWHDTIFNMPASIGAIAHSAANNIITMPVAAAVTYGTLMDDAWSQSMYMYSNEVK